MLVSDGNSLLVLQFNGSNVVLLSITEGSSEICLTQCLVIFRAYFVSVQCSPTITYVFNDSCKMNFFMSS